MELSPEQQRRIIVDHYTIGAEAKVGLDTLGVSCQVPAHGSNVATCMVHAVDMVTRGLNEKVKRHLSGIPEDLAIKEEFGYVCTRHPEARETRALEENEMEDMTRCVYTYGGRVMEWIRQRFPNYTAGWNDLYTDYAPMSALATGRRLAILKRVIHVNPESWDKPPLFIPSGFGLHMWLQQDLRTDRPPEWLAAMEAALNVYGMGADGMCEAANAVRKTLNLPMWSRMAQR